MCVYNNTKGDADAEVRERYEEPAWNNPVVRVVDARGRDLVPRLSGDWSAGGLADLMVRALRKAGTGVPRWLSLLEQETTARARGVETAVFGMT